MVRCAVHNTLFNLWGSEKILPLYSHAKELAELEVAALSVPEAHCVLRAMANQWEKAVRAAWATLQSELLHKEMDMSCWGHVINKVLLVRPTLSQCEGFCCEIGARPLPPPPRSTDPACYG